MAKKDLANVTADLSALASMMPTQRTAVAPPPETKPELVKPPETSVPEPKPSVRPAKVAKTEEISQFSLSLRETLRKQLNRMASDADMTARAFILNALKEKGLAVKDEDLLDRRKTRH